MLTKFTFGKTWKNKKAVTPIFNIQKYNHVLFVNFSERSTRLTICHVRKTFNYVQTPQLWNCYGRQSFSQSLSYCKTVFQKDRMKWHIYKDWHKISWKDMRFSCSISIVLFSEKVDPSLHLFLIKMECILNH